MGEPVDEDVAHRLSQLKARSEQALRLAQRTVASSQQAIVDAEERATRLALLRALRRRSRHASALVDEDLASRQALLPCGSIRPEETEVSRTAADQIIPVLHHAR